MSANNVIWVMQHEKYDNKFHVWYSGCYDNVPTEPDTDGEFYCFFRLRGVALLYAHNLVKYIEKERGYIEYGVMEV